MTIAIFADVHGRILLCFKLCARWQRETGQHIDLILQAGDLGVFPDPARLDRATVTHARSNASELGFAEHFTAYQPEIAAVLSETNCPLVFVRGNHEDHDWLDDLERAATGPVFAVDPYRRVFCLRTGLPYPRTTAADALSILGIGRLGAPGGKTGQKQTYIQKHESERLNRLSQARIDLLLTHDSARNFVTVGYGMDDIRLILDAYRPVYHFYGHTGEPYTQRLDANGVTVSCKLADLDWEPEARGPVLPPGAMGILTWHDRDSHTFNVVDAPWLKEYSAHSWLYM